MHLLKAMGARCDTAQFTVLSWAAGVPGAIMPPGTGDKVAMPLGSMVGAG